MADDPGQDRTMGARCPICGKPAGRALRPFCSKRCADVDLQRWFTGAYALPVNPDEAKSGDADEEQ